MGFGKLYTHDGIPMNLRSTEYTVKDTATGVIETYSVPNGIDPDWSGGGVYSGAMGIPACWRAANLLADLVGLCPFYAYRGGDLPINRVSPTPAMLDQPYPPDTRIDTFSSMALDYLWHGNAIGIIAARNSENVPTAFVPQPAQLIEVRRSPADNRVKYRVFTEQSTLDARGRYIEWDQSEVIHIKGPHAPGALRGMGVLEAHFNGALTLAKTQNRQALSVVRSSGVPTGLLTTDSEDVTTDELKTAKESWLQAQAERTIAALGWGTKFQAMAWNPTDQQLLESRSFSLNEIELLFGLPVGWLGGMNSARQYSNIEQDAINLLKFTLAGPLSRFEQTLSLLYPRGTIVQADMSEISRADTLQRYEGYQIGVDGGWLAPSEVRTAERMPPLTEAQKQELKERNTDGSAQAKPAAGQEGGPAKLRRVQ